MNRLLLIGLLTISLSGCSSNNYYCNRNFVHSNDDIVLDTDPEGKIVVLAISPSGSVRICHLTNRQIREFKEDNLAPRPLFFHDPESIEEWVKQYQDLKEFIQKIHPGADVMVTRVENPPSDPHWFKLPFTWKEMSVWVKYHNIYDTRGSHANSRGEVRLFKTDA